MLGFPMADAASVRLGAARWAPHVKSFAAANARATAQTLAFDHAHGELHRVLKDSADNEL